jgi:hypothetical protein
MNRPARHFFVIAASLLLATPALPGAPAARAKSVDQFARTKAHIDALLKGRLNPEPVPANPPNPFQLPGGGTAVADIPTNKNPGPKPELPPLLSSDAEILAHLTATLKITGIVKLNDQLHLIVNQAPYKEGDRIPVSNNSTVTYIQVIRISPAEITVGLNDVVQVLKFKN